MINHWQLAKSIEEEGMMTYESLAKRAPNKELSGVFTTLADEERRHYELFSEMEKNMPVELFSEESKQIDLLETLHTTLLEMKNDNIKLKTMHDAEKGYRNSLNLEKKSIEAYNKIMDDVKDIFQKSVLRLIIEEETRHVKLIEELIDFVHRPKEWLENAEVYHLDEY